jgi:hypothetical protein
MTTVLWGMLPKSSVLLCLFCVKKELVQRIFIDKFFPVYGGKCLLRKVVYTWIKKFSQGRSKAADDARRVAETTVKRLLCSEFRRTGKAMGQVYQWRTCREINVFPRFEYHMFYVLYQFVTCLLPLPRV